MLVSSRICLVTLVVAAMGVVVAPSVAAQESVPVDDTNRFGQGNAIVHTVVPGADPELNAFVIIGEPWRDDNQEAGMGQVYIYKKKP